MSLEKGFIEAIKEATKEGKTAYDTVAKVRRVKDGTAWVHIDGGVDETPAELTINANKGDLVRIRVSGGKAYLIGNSTDPPASGQALLVIGKNTQEVVDILKANNITAKTAVIEHLEANDAIINRLKLEKLDVDLANITNATITNLRAGNAEVDGLNAYYANIDGANILEAFIGQVFNKNAMIEDAIVTTLDATGRITAVRINADYINANTLKANRIIFLGADGLFHQLNENGETRLPDQTDSNSLNGSVITAESITADKLTVTDLSAFGADIAGLKLEDSSIHTYGKDSPYSTVEGWYIGTADGGGGLQDNDGDIILSADGRDFDTRSERYNGFTIGNAEEYMRFAGGVLEIKSRDLDANFLKRSEYLTQTKYTFGRRMSGTTVANWSVEEGQDNEASGLSSHAEGTFSKATGHMSHSEGYHSEASGTGAHVEGNWSVASGDYSHAEGIEGKATGDYAHAEGYFSEASGEAAHAEGRGTAASGYYSHAEGKDADAVGNYSHAEGYYTAANGESAHAEGRETRASGKASHASGGYTAAESDYQTVIGKHNVSDPNGRYVFIIGGGPGEDIFTEYASFSSANLVGKNICGAKIKFDADGWSEGYPMGTNGDWILKSTGNVTKTLYQTDTWEEPAGDPDWCPPVYRYAPDDCPVSRPGPPYIDYELTGVLTASGRGEVIWNPTSDFVVSSINTSHPLYQYLKIAFPLMTAKRNILAVDWDGNIHIPSTASVIADL